MHANFEFFYHFKQPCQLKILQELMNRHFFFLLYAYDKQIANLRLERLSLIELVTFLVGLWRHRDYSQFGIVSW